ncbi:MAG: transposase [Chryseotalea sp. WA131a]|nr:MAG: transposase [Chryseotalea sp. WA131a]
MKNRTRGLFDEQFRLNKMGKQNDPLIKLQAQIDFEIFRTPLKTHFEFGKDRSQGGRPSFDYLMMFKILILQRLGLNISDTVPDAKTIWNFTLG